MGKKKKKKNLQKLHLSSADDSDALLAAAIAENQQRELEDASSTPLAAESVMTLKQQHLAQARMQAETRTLIPGQPIPKEIRDSLQAALDEIDRQEKEEKKTLGIRDVAVDEEDRPFHYAPPSASNDPRILSRQKKMLHRMRKKQQENAERRALEAIDPKEAENCKRYNLTEKQLRAVRMVGLSLPHECKEKARQKEEEKVKAKEDEDDVFGLGEEPSLEDMFGALRADDQFMSAMGKASH